MKKILFSTLLCVLGLGFATAQTQYFFEDFEAGVPAGWTVTGEWSHGDQAAQNSQYQAYTGNDTNFMAFNDDAQGNGHVGGGLVTSAPIDLTAVTGTVFLEMFVNFRNGDYGGADEIFKVYASTDGGANWDELDDYGALGWTRVFYSIDAYAGSMLTLGFEYDDGATWNFGCAFDDISVSDELILTPSRDYTMTVNGGSQFNQCGENVDYPIQGVLLNNAYVPITSFNVNVISNGTTSTYTIDNVNIEQNDAMRYEVPEMLNTGTSLSTHMVSISNVNGVDEDDANTTDNSAMITFAPVPLNPNQAVVVEEATGTWCTWCPRGTVYIDEMSKRFGHNFVGIAVHNNDPMADAEYDGALTSFPGFQGFPSVVYNRESIQDPGAIVAPAIASMSATPIATIEVGAEENGSTLSTSAKVTFLQDAPGANHSVVVILTEDDLTGTEAGWNQTSASYAGGAQGPMGGWEYFPTSVPSSWWPYSHVGRALIGGWDGVNGIVGDFTAGSSPSVYMEDYTMDASWNTENMHIIALLLDASGEVVNAVSGKYSDVVAAGSVTNTDDVLESNFAAVYPNPTSDVANIAMNLVDASDVNVILVDNLGRTVSSRNYGNQSGYVQLQYNVGDITPGLYLVHIQVNDQILTKKLTIK